jgi:hypothetical protein
MTNGEEKNDHTKRSRLSGWSPHPPINRQTAAALRGGCWGSMLSTRRVTRSVKSSQAAHTHTVTHSYTQLHTVTHSYTHTHTNIGERGTDTHAVGLAGCWRPLVCQLMTTTQMTIIDGPECVAGG